MSPSDVSKMLSSLISRCRIPLAWQYLRPSIIYLKRCLATSSLSFLLLLTYVNRSPAPHTSITNTICYGVSNDSQSLTMFRWRVLCKILNSCITFLFEASSERNVLLIDFKATNLPERRCIAKLTFPKAPFPITLPTLQNSDEVAGGLLVF